MERRRSLEPVGLAVLRQEATRENTPDDGEELFSDDDVKLGQLSHQQSYVQQRDVRLPTLMLTRPSSTLLRFNPFLRFTVKHN